MHNSNTITIRCFLNSVPFFFLLAGFGRVFVAGRLCNAMQNTAMQTKRRQSQLFLQLYFNNPKTEKYGRESSLNQAVNVIIVVLFSAVDSAEFSVQYAVCTKPNFQANYD